MSGQEVAAEGSEIGCQIRQACNLGTFGISFVLLEDHQCSLDFRSWLIMLLLRRGNNTTHM